MSRIDYPSPTLNQFICLLKLMKDKPSTFEHALLLGWHDWFCPTNQLIDRARKYYTIINKLKDSEKYLGTTIFLKHFGSDIDTTGLYFKNIDGTMSLFIEIREGFISIYDFSISDKLSECKIDSVKNIKTATEYLLTR